MSLPISEVFVWANNWRFEVLLAKQTALTCITISEGKVDVVITCQGWHIHLEKINFGEDLEYVASWEKRKFISSEGHDENWNDTLTVAGNNDSPENRIDLEAASLSEDCRLDRIPTDSRQSSGSSILKNSVHITRHWKTKNIYRSSSVWSLFTYQSISFRSQKQMQRAP